MQESFAHISGRIRALESKSIKKSDIERMLHAKDAEAAFEVLNDVDFSDGMLKGVSYKDFEKVLQTSLLNTKDFLIKTTPENGIINIIWAWFDYYNIKTCLKAKLKGISFEDITYSLSPFGNIDFKEIKDAIFQNKLFELDRLNNLKEKAFKEFEKSQSLQKVDIICDKDMYGYFIWKSEKIGSQMMINFYKKLVDITNCVTYLRFQDSYTEEFFIDGGILNKNLFLKGNKDEINEKIKSTILHGESIADIFSCDGFAKINSIFDKQLIKLIEGTRLIAFGREIVFAYFWKRFKAAEVIRTIMVGKQNNLPKEIMEEAVNKILI